MYNHQQHTTLSSSGPQTKLAIIVNWFQTPEASSETMPSSAVEASTMLWCQTILSSQRQHLLLELWGLTCREQANTRAATHASTLRVSCHSFLLEEGGYACSWQCCVLSTPNCTWLLHFNCSKAQPCKGISLVLRPQWRWCGKWKINKFYWWA